MANRSYLYALSHSPTSYRDRPDTIVGVSEWAYDVPFVYYLLISGQTRVCASLVSDGFEDDDDDAKTPLYALTGDFATGLARLQRFAAALSSAAPSSSRQLRESIAEALSFLQAHRDRYFLLETIELDCMDTADAAELAALAQQHLAAAQAAGAAVDTLTRFSCMAGRLLRKAVIKGEGRLAPFRGLSLKDDFDHASTGRVLGMGEWSEVLYFALQDKTSFEARDRADAT
ncbi:hypothetical protein IMZ29_14700 [Achromobacter sp. GG226]|uniref:DUF7822 domain-containing protein n=1 Tax=Verticiella alkaliphila TaxID=2779529 RepID=UPI001C0C6846|nr:hypothetical protein [Verticiella sp. GG226]MBU4611737.1 hypothetical protein [Verticiella sp. GG226]